jgi:threonine aldolase
LRGIDEVLVDGPHTNMLFVTVPADRLALLVAFLQSRGVLVLARSPTLRLVTHLDVDAAGVERATAVFAEFFARH